MTKRVEYYRRQAAFMLKMALVKEVAGDMLAACHFLQQAIDYEAKEKGCHEAGAEE